MKCKKHGCLGPDGKLNPTYRRWAGMVARCENPKHPAWPWYGGRGISVDPRWRGKQGFSNFMDDLGPVPPGLTLERKDGKQGYSPENCRWATWKEQAANRSQGGHKNINPNSLRQKAIKANLSYQLVYLRINRLHWPEEKALSTPVHIKPPSAYKLFLQRLQQKTTPQNLTIPNNEQTAT